MFYFVNFIEVKSKNAVVWDFKPRLGQASRYNILRDFTLSKKATQFAGGRINLIQSDFAPPLVYAASLR